MVLFDKFLDFINLFRPQKPETAKFETYSRFKEYLFFLDPKDESYESVSRAVDLCEEALKIARHRALSLRKLNDYNIALKDVECYEKLSEEDAKYLKSLVDKFVGLTKERNVLRYQIVDFDKAINSLSELEDEAADAIIKMEDAERQERILRQDLQYLKDEKNDLENERENLEFGSEFLYKFTIGCVGVFAVSVIVLVLLAVFKNQNIFFPLTILSILLIFVIGLIYVFKRRIKFELKINIKKQSRAVQLLNKKTVVYSYYVNFLNYVYKKYNVRSSASLRANLNDYGHYKHVASRYDSIRNIMFETQKMLEDFLRKKNIKDVNASIEKFAQTINVDDKLAYCKEINTKKAEVEATLADLDQKHEVIWDELTKLNVEDKSQDSIIERIIKTYLDEAGKLIFDVDKEEEV